MVNKIITCRNNNFLNLRLLFFSVSLVFLLSFLFFKGEILNNYNEFNSSQLPSTSKKVLSPDIKIIKAEKLDKLRNPSSNIFDSVKKLDGLWSETVLENHYIRIKFEINLTSDKDITIYPRIVSGNPSIEIYEKDGKDPIAVFNSLNNLEYNKVYLINLKNEQDIFDLKVLNGDVQFDYITDPSVNDCGSLTEIGEIYTQMNDIVPSDSSVPCISIEANDITFDGNGFWIANSAFNNTGIYATGLTGITVQNVNVTVNRTATNSNGIEFVATNNSVIENSIFNSNYYGIYLRGRSNNDRITNVTTNKNNFHGLFLDSSSNNNVTSIISNNNSIHGVFLSSTTSNPNNNTFNEITAINNSGRGISLSSSNENRFNNIIVNANLQYGILLTSSNNNTFENITANYNQAGIYIGDGSENNNLTSGTINASKDKAVYFYYEDINGNQENIMKNNIFKNLNITETNLSGFDLFVEFYQDLGNGWNTYFGDNYFINTPLKNYTIIETSAYTMDYGVKLIIEDTRFGEVKFLQPVNGTGTNLTEDIRILNNSVTVRSNINTGLNRSANVTLYNLRTDLGDPVILRDGSSCASTICMNFTHLNMGNVTFNVTHWTNYTIWDVTPPRVNITSPTNQTYTTSTFLVNITLHEGGACQYSLNNGVTNKTLSADPLNKTFNATETGVSNGDYIIKTYCNDTVGNTNYTTNTSFSVSVSGGSSGGSSGGGGSGGSGGGGGGASYLGQTYTIKSEDLIKGYSLDLLAKDRILFIFNSIVYNITLDSYNFSTASVTIRPSLLAVNLESNKSKTIDLNYDKKDDLNIIYNGIGLTKAKIFLQTLYEENPEETNQDPEIVQENNSKQNPKNKINKSLIYNLIFGVLIIAGLVVLRLIISRQR